MSEDRKSGTVVSVNLSEKKTVRKKRFDSGVVIEDRGFEGDAHAGDWHRQVSLLAQESIDKMRAAGLDVGPGDFAENITTQGLELMTLPIGTTLRAGDALLEISQIGKVCHTRCAIYYQAGDCVMPKEGVFAVARTAGTVAVGDSVEVLALGDGTCDRVPDDAETPEREAKKEAAKPPAQECKAAERTREAG